MSSTSETGYPTKLGNLANMITMLESFGDSYNPANPNITLQALKEKFKLAETSLNNINITKAALDNIINERIATYKATKGFVTRLINSLLASGFSEETLGDAKIIQAKINGRRVNVVKKEVVASPNSATAQTVTETIISVSQQSYVSISANFEKLIEFISAQPEFKPNEEGFAPEALRKKAARLKELNASVNEANTAWFNSRVERDNIFFNKETGISILTKYIKAYVKSITGSADSRYRKISAISFR